MFSNKPQEVRERILETARDLFTEKGYSGTSIRDIATASGTNVAMVNYYFHSKYKLFEHIFGEYLEILTKRIFNILTSDLPILDLIDQWVDSYYDILQEYPQIPIFILNEVNTHPEELLSKVKHLNPYNIILIMTQKIEEGISQGVIRKTSPVDLMLNILSLCVFPFAFSRVAIPASGKTPEEYNALLYGHKKYVKEFIFHSIKI